MTKISFLFAGVLVAAFPLTTKAATFTPDMWVYEVTYTLKSVDPDMFFAETTFTGPLEAVPAGCVVGSYSTLPLQVSCRSVPAGLDLVATLDPSVPRTLSGRIGFNASGIVCSGIIGECPKNAEDTGSDGDWFGVSKFDATLGVLSYSSQLADAGDYGGHNFSRGAVTGFAGVNAGRISGIWDFGDGGRWQGIQDPLLMYSVDGRLLSSPEVIPLPAPVLMLGSALALFGAFRRRSSNS